MGRFLGGLAAVALLVGASATAASAQVRVGINTRDFGVNVAIGSPRVHVVERYHTPYYRPLPVYRPVPVPVYGRGRYDDRYYRDRAKREREYRKDVREARREYAKDIREARREYERAAAETSDPEIRRAALDALDRLPR